jgi:hypothetical protein
MHLALLPGLSLLAPAAPSSSSTSPKVPASSSTAAPTPLAWPDLVTPQGGLGPGGQDAALVIGIGTYRSLPPLPGAADTARRFATWLKESRGVPPQRVTLLVDKEATGDAIRAALQKLGGSGATGVVWLVYIGHGAPDANGLDGLLLPVDIAGNRSAVDRFGISQQDVLRVLDAGTHRTSVAIYDATFSRLQGDGRTPLVDGWEERLPNRHGRSPPRKTMVLATHDGCAPALPDGGRPAFSYLLLGALQGWGDDNGDAVVDAGEAMRFAREAIPRCAAGEERLPPWSPGTSASLGVTVRARRDIQPVLDAMKARLSSSAPPPPRR